jgi:hypothetical protein
MWAAQDDYWEPNWVEALHHRIERTASIGAMGRVRIVDNWGREHRSNQLQSHGFRYAASHSAVRRQLGYLWDPEFHGKSNMMYGLYRTSLLRNAALSVPSDFWKQQSGDLHLVHKLLEVGSIAQVPETTMYKRVHSAQQSSRSATIALPPQSRHASARTLDHVNKLSPRPLDRALYPIQVECDRFVGVVSASGLLPRMVLNLKVCRLALRQAARSIRARLAGNKDP